MRRTIASIVVFAGFLLPAAAQKNELKEMGRDIALLQEEVRNMQKSEEQRLTNIEASLKTILDQLNATTRTVSAMDATMRDRVEKSLAGPMRDMGSKVDTLADDYRFIKETMAELNQRMNKLSLQVTDLSTAVRTMQAPPAAPSAAPGGPGGPPAGLTAEALYKDALRDKSAANFDLALRGFNDYLNWFGTTDLAPNAQYYIGEIYYNQKQYEESLKAFDNVLAAYPNNAKTLDARFMKGRALVKLGQRDEGAQEFRALIAASPNSELAARARGELKSLGLSTSAPAPSRRK